MVMTTDSTASPGLKINVIGQTAVGATSSEGNSPVLWSSSAQYVPTTPLFPLCEGERIVSLTRYRSSVTADHIASHYRCYNIRSISHTCYNARASWRLLIPYIFCDIIRLLSNLDVMFEQKPQQRRWRYIVKATGGTY